MSDNQMKLELILLGKDMLGKILGKDIGFLKQFKKEGDGAAKAADKLDAARKKSASSAATAANAAKKEKDETSKLGDAAEKAAKAEEKLNNARKRKSGDNKTKKETDDKNKLAGATEKAAKAEEKLNNAKNKGSRKSSSRGSNNRNFEDDLISGGTGAGMLWTAKEGLTSAMSKQEALTDLYNAFYRGSLGAQELNAQMRKGEQIADQLGNKLPGTTADYLTLFATMKQRGIEANVILQGAGESAAYLSVANKEDRQETGANIARFGQMFDLKTKSEYMGAADLMSRAKTTYGIGSSELMEAVKDFSGRTGKGLGLDGGKGAEDTLRFLAFLRAKTGMEGLTVGTSASSFFGQYLQAKQKKKDPTEELKKLTGVDLQIFDKKGKFLGLENAVKEFSKLKGKLSDEQMVGFGSQIAGEEGSAVFQAMVKNGHQWGAFNSEMTDASSLMDVSAKNAENLTNKIEALTGSLSNLGAAGFQPLIAPLSKLTDKSNEFVGSLTEYAKAHPALAATTASVLSLGGAYLTLKGGSGVLSRLTGATALVGDTAAASSKKVGGLKGNLLSLPNIVKIALAIEMAGIAWDQFETLRKTVNQWKEMNNGLDSAGSQSYNAQKQEDQTLKEQGKTPDYKLRAQEAMNLLQAGSKEFEKALDPNRMTWMESYSKIIGSIVSGEKLDFYTPGGGVERWKKKSPEQQEAEKKEYSQLSKEYATQPVPKMFSDSLDRATKEILGADTIRRRVPMLENPNTMTAFRKDVLPGLNLSNEMNAHVQKMLERAFPDSYKQSNQQLLIEQARLMDQSGQLGQSFTNLMLPTEGLKEGFATTLESTNKAVTGMNNFANSANSLAMRVNGIEIIPPTFSPIQVPVFGQNPVAPPVGPGRARGGSVTRGKSHPVGENGIEWFTPTSSGSIVSNDMLRRKGSNSGATFHINFSPTVSVTSDNPNRAELLADINRQLASLKRELIEEYSPDRLAQKVEWAAQRDAERT